MYSEINMVFTKSIGWEFNEQETWLVKLESEKKYVLKTSESTFDECYLFLIE